MPNSMIASNNGIVKKDNDTLDKSNINITFDPLKVEMRDSNPWLVEDVSSFLKYCCPECSYSDRDLETFSNHALGNHKSSVAFFSMDEVNIKTENQDYDHDYFSLESTTTDLSPPDNSNMIQSFDGFDVKGIKVEKTDEELKKEVFESSNVSSVTEKRPYTCDVCQKTLKNKHTLKEHVIRVHEGNGQRSDKYKLKDPKRAEKYRKMLKVIGLKDPPKICPKPNCDYTTRELKLLNYHLDTKHPDSGQKSHFCDLCEKGFIHNTSLQMHKRKDHKEGKKCPHCEYTTTDSSTVNSNNQWYLHVDKNHSDIYTKKFFCDYCSEGFIYNTSLRAHKVKKHKDCQIINSCPHCDFKDKSSIRFYKHIETKHPEHGPKNFFCENCKMGFIFNSSLSLHKNLQNNCKKVLKPDRFDKQCPYCDYKTNLKSRWCIHIDTKHPEHDEKKHFCEKCNKGYIFQISMTTHARMQCQFSTWKKAYYGAKSVCEHCGLSITNHHMKKHMRTIHSSELFPNGDAPKFVCEQCGYSTVSSGYLKHHIFTKHAPGNLSRSIDNRTVRRYEWPTQKTEFFNDHQLSIFFHQNFWDWSLGE